MVTVNRLEREEIVTYMDGNLKRKKKVTLVSYDNIHWQMDQQKAHTRFKRASRLRPKFGKKAVQRVTATATRKEQPVLLPVSHHGAVMLGKAKGKNQKHKRNLRVKKERHVASQVVTGPTGQSKVLRKSHYHWCHGKQLVCQCDTPYFRRLCGGDLCLVSGIRKENVTK